MASKVSIPSCPTCGYPVAASFTGQTAVCANCGTSLIAQEGITVKPWLLAGIIGLALGIILGPAMLSTTDAGSRWLARQVRTKLER